MDDNEAEVDLAVNASILLANAAADNEVIAVADNTDDIKESEDTEPNENDTVNISSNEETVLSIDDGQEPTEYNENENEPALTGSEVDDSVPIEDGPLEDADTEVDVPAADSNLLTESDEAVETVIDVSSVSKDHISPTPKLSGSPNIHDTTTTQTETAEHEISPMNSPGEKGSDNNSGGMNDSTMIQENDTIDSERHQSESLGNVINITFQSEDGEKTVSMRIVDATYKKPFLGGFRNKRTGVEYLNASSQTYPKKVIPKAVEVFSRDTQTVQKKSQMQQTTYDTSTQMTKPGCYVSDEKDVILIPGTYVTADEQEKTKLEKVIIIQSYWRRWLASQYVKQVKEDRDMRIEWELQESKRIAAERADRLRQEFERRMQPKTKSDFDLLYAALEGWRQEEIDRIDNSHSGPERKAALIALLEQEAYLIQSIERHRLNADEANYSDNVVQFLDKAAQPKFWRAYDGGKTEMNTRYSLRAQELRDIYNSLQTKYLNQDERLDILLTLKHTVKEHDCKITQEMIELIDREADLLTRNVKSANLEGLRQRISTLFLQYCKTPSFNPDVARLLKVPKDASSLRKDIYFCPSCNSYLPSTEFPLASNSRIVGRCKKCSKLDNNARLRHDFTKIRSILQHLRRSEEQHNDGSKIAFIIQDADLRYLIEKIWNSQSALSGLEDLYDLVFVRWNKYEHWSPWNCLLVTKEEASAHMKLENITEAYGRIFVGKVHHRHVVAKQYFSKLTKISNNMTKTSIPKPKATAVI